MEGNVNETIEQRMTRAVNAEGYRVFDFYKHRNDVIKNLGFAYKNKIFLKTMSPQITSEPKRKAILDKFEAVVYYLIESVKTIKTYFNYAVDKDYKKLN